MNRTTRIAGLFLFAGLLGIASPALPQQAFPAQAPGASPQIQPYYGYQPEYYGYQPQWQAPVSQGSVRRVLQNRLMRPWYAGDVERHQPFAEGADHDQGRG